MIKKYTTLLKTCIDEAQVEVEKLLGNFQSELKSFVNESDDPENGWFNETIKKFNEGQAKFKEQFFDNTVEINLWEKLNAELVESDAELLQLVQAFENKYANNAEMAKTMMIYFRDATYDTSEISNDFVRAYIDGIIEASNVQNKLKDAMAERRKVLSSSLKPVMDELLAVFRKGE